MDFEDDDNMSAAEHEALTAWLNDPYTEAKRREICIQRAEALQELESLAQMSSDPAVASASRKFRMLDSMAKVLGARDMSYGGDRRG